MINVTSKNDTQRTCMKSDNVHAYNKVLRMEKYTKDIKKTKSRSEEENTDLLTGNVTLILN